MIINEIVRKISGESLLDSSINETTRKMRSAEEIMRDYGLGGGNDG